MHTYWVQAVTGHDDTYPKALMYPKVQKRIPPHPAATDQALTPPSGYVNASAFSEAKGVPSWKESPRRLSGSFCISTEDIWGYGSDEKTLPSQR